MAEIWIPALLRDLTNGHESITIPGDTVGQVIDQLETRYPGFKDRLCEEGRLRPNIAVVVDGETSQRKLHQPLSATSAVYFVPAISGG